MGRTTNGKPITPWKGSWAERMCQRPEPPKHAGWPLGSAPSLVRPSRAPGSKV